MVLSDVEIEAEIAQKRLVFDPPITNLADRIDSSAVDLLLHPDLILLPPRPVAGVTIVPTDNEVQVMELLLNHGDERSLAGQPYRMEPHRLIIGKTLEKVTLPNHLAAWIEGKSSLARFGLAVHITAPTVMAGFEGRLFLEMYNAGPFHIELAAGMKIAQLVLERVGLPPSQEYQGQFAGQA